MATEYGYLMDRQMLHLPKHGIRLAHDSLGTRSVREFTLILHRGHSVYADVKTGTLYDATIGDCLGTRQMRIVLDAEVKVTRKRKDTAAREHEGWVNDKRRAAS